MARARSASAYVNDEEADASVVATVARRQQAAVQLVAAGAVSVVDASAGTATVVSSNGQQQYAVTASTNSLSCSCPDGLKGRVCKHIRAAVLVLGNAAAYVPASHAAGQGKVRHSPSSDLCVVRLRLCPSRSISFREGVLTVAAWHEARLHPAEVPDEWAALLGVPDGPGDPNMGDEGEARGEGEHDDGGGQHEGEGNVADPRRTEQLRLEAAWEAVHGELAHTGFEPYETARLATLLEQAAGALAQARRRRTVLPLARRRPLVPPPPASQSSDGTLRVMRRPGRPRKADEAPMSTDAMLAAMEQWERPGSQLQDAPKRRRVQRVVDK
jgi:hypothetical protein